MFITIWMLLLIIGIGIIPEDTYYEAGNSVIGALLIWFCIITAILFPTGVFHLLVWKMCFRKKAMKMWKLMGDE